MKADNSNNTEVKQDVCLLNGLHVSKHMDNEDIVIRNSSNEIVMNLTVDVNKNYFTERQTKQIATRICKCVNAHEELVKCLSNLLSSYRADFKTITGADLNDTEAVKFAKEVLAKNK